MKKIIKRIARKLKKAKEELEVTAAKEEVEEQVIEKPLVSEKVPEKAKERVIVREVVKDETSKKIIEKLEEEIKKLKDELKQVRTPVEGKAPQKIIYAQVPKEVIVPTISKEELKVATRGREKEIRYKTIDLKEVIKGKHVTIKYEEERRKKLAEIDIKYPLISINYKGKSYVMAYAHIYWDKRLNTVVYEVVEPPLSEKEKEALEEVKRALKERLDIDVSKVRKEEAYNYLMKQTDRVIKELGLKLSETQLLKFHYYIYRDFIGLGKIEPLMRDANIEDITADGVGIPVFVYHKNPLLGYMRTNIVFNTKEELDGFVLKLAQKCGKTLTVAEPLVDGALPDGSRLQATLGTDIAMKGSNFTIRKFTSKPLTPIDLIMFGTATPELFAYLWLAIENKMSILVAGATATGKTTFLNAISLFIKPEFKIISIEDTAELKLPHPNWMPHVARPGFGIKRYGEVSMFDLLKAALRQRPDYIIVGEIRGKEAYVMFQGMATGHPGLGTLHADTVEAVIDRLTTPPINLPLSLLENLDIIVFLTLTRKRGEYIRRVKNVIEVVGYDYKKKKLITNESFEWKPENDELISKRSILLDKIRELMGYDIEALKADLARRIKILEWMLKKGIRDYDKFSKIISLYYANPKEVEEMIKREEEKEKREKEIKERAKEGESKEVKKEEQEKK